jgi:hypothetical protein
MNERLAGLKDYFFREDLEHLLWLRDRHRFVLPEEIELLEQVIEQKIAEESGDGTVCPPPVRIPSGVAEMATGDPNDTSKPVDMFGQQNKPSPAPPRDEVEQERQAIEAEIEKLEKQHPAPAPALAVPPHAVHQDGTRAGGFVGVLPGNVKFSNPGRSEGQKKFIPRSSELKID